jgi:hypothetical protein
MLNVASYLCNDHSATILGTLPADEQRFAPHTEGKNWGRKWAWDYLHGKAEERSADADGYDVPCKWGDTLPTQAGEYPCSIHFPEGAEPGTLVLFDVKDYGSPSMYGYWVLNSDAESLEHARKCAAQQTTYVD